MLWTKKGHIFTANSEFEWMKSHAANPFAIKLSDDIYRIFFTVRDSNSRSYITYGDFDVANGFKLIQLSPIPVLEPGEPGLFDDSGVAVGYVLSIDNELVLYYLGWNLKVTVPWLNTIGRAIWSPDENKFIKCSKAPMMDRSEEDPYSISYPSVLYDIDKFRMWYGSNLSWGKTQESMQHVIKYAESRDGKNWVRTNKIAINLEHPGEYALSKPFVLKLNGIYLMWYSYRGNGFINTYRIGYAESNDGHTWSRRDDHVGINISESGWDSEMISYPFVFDFNDKYIMLYNGNGYGKTGFGWAICGKNELIREDGILTRE
jgi:hypothetical protein